MNNIGRKADIHYEDLDKIVELKLSLVDPEYRGNNLQSRMTTHLMKLVRGRRASVRYSCAIVSPKNIPSLADKFAQNMKLSKMLLVNDRYWRCVFVGDLRGRPLTPIKSTAKISNRDIESQIDLLDRGYFGYGLSKNGGECRIVYAR
jgi:hypothetical protein